ncbi:MAG: glycosyltransferase family 39 protein [Flavobacteriaceae bacterium]|nr:glycosyltransferase family 39 protein [Flavobacteriaceae bacterium]
MNLKFIAFLIITFLILIIGVGSWGLTESSEARYAEIAKEMVDTGDFVNPTLLGIKHFHKPPFTYYITSIGFKLFGINEFGARFFMQIALIFQLILVFLIAQILYKNKKIAFAASLIYLSFPLVLISVRNLTTDAFLNTFILAAIYFWLRYRNSQKAYYLYFFYLFLGLIFETKGPVGLIIPITFIITTKIIFKEKIQHSLHQYLGILLFFIIGASWFILLFNSNHGLLNYFINHQIIDRVAVDKFNRSEPFWYYLLLVPLVGFPMFFLLFSNFKSYFLSIFKQQNIERSFVISFLVFLTVLSLSTSKLILYALPLYGIAALLLANKLFQVSEKWLNSIIYMYTIFIGILIIAPIPVSFLLPEIKIHLYSTLIITFLIITILIFIYKNKSIAKTSKILSLGFLLMFTLIAESNLFFKNNELAINAIKPIATFIKEQSENQNKTVIVYDRLLPSLSFYLNQPIITINNGYYTTQRETNFELSNQWKKFLINYKIKSERDSLLTLTRKKNTFLIMKKNAVEPDSIKLIRNNFKSLKTFGYYIVYY